MIRNVVIPPIGEPLSLSDVKQHLRIETDDENVLLTGLITSAREQVEMFTGRQLLRQTLDLSFDGFADPLFLGAPLVSVTSVSYIDAAGATQTVSPSDYVTVAPNFRPEPRGFIHPAWGKSWPTPRSQPNAVTVRAVFGYSKADDLPAMLRSAILLLVADLYENRTGQTEQQLAQNITLQRLLYPWCVQWF